MMEDKPWVDYLGLGIRSEHIPALTTILDEIDEFPLCDDDDPCTWMPMHAWRALAQLQAETALPTMVKLLNLIDNEDDEIVQVDLPAALSRMCPAAIPHLIEFLEIKSNGLWARLSAAEAMQVAALDKPELRSTVVATLTSTLAGYASADEIFNTLLVDLLMKLQAVEAAHLVEQVFKAGKIDEMIYGDWEDFQVGVGLLQERLTSRALHQVSADSFQDVFFDQRDILPDEPGKKKEDSKTKKKRKLETESRKVNRKKKK